MTRKDVACDILSTVLLLSVLVSRTSRLVRSFTTRCVQSILMSTTCSRICIDLGLYTLRCLFSAPYASSRQLYLPRSRDTTAVRATPRLERAHSAPMKAESAPRTTEVKH